jgi:hypothetical protein
MAARRAKNAEVYREIVCKECGYDYFRLPVEGMIAKPPYAVCGKCGYQQTVKPGDIMKNEDAKKTRVSLAEKKK